MTLPECCEISLAANGASCVFGCNAVVDDDTKMCPRCRDHSANSFECDSCGQQWEHWGDAWEMTAHAPSETCDCEKCLAAMGTYKPGHSGGFPF